MGAQTKRPIRPINGSLSFTSSVVLECGTNVYYKKSDTVAFCTNV